MANYAAVQAAMAAIQSRLMASLPAELTATPISASVELFGSHSASSSASNVLGLYLHRVETSAGSLSANRRAPASAIAITLHFILFALAESQSAEVDLLSWSVQYFAANPVLPASSLASQGPTLPGQSLNLDDVEALRISAETLTPSDTAIVLGALSLPFRLSAAYSVAGLLLTP